MLSAPLTGSSDHRTGHPMLEALRMIFAPPSRRSKEALAKADEAKRSSESVQEAVNRRNGSIKSLEATIAEMTRKLEE